MSSHGFAQNQLILWKYPALTKVAELTGQFASCVLLIVNLQCYQLLLLFVFVACSIIVFEILFSLIHKQIFGKLRINVINSASYNKSKLSMSCCFTAVFGLKRIFRVIHHYMSF